jgi:hypothetical protein
MCKEVSRTFSTCRKVKKVQEKSGSIRFWKYDAIHGYIKTDSEPKQETKRKLSGKLAEVQRFMSSLT